VATGPDSSVTLDIDGDEGNLLQVAGQLTLDVFGFAALNGSFAFKKANGTFTIADGETSTQLTADYLAIGADITTATVQAGGVGLELNGIELAMVLVSDQP